MRDRMTSNDEGEDVMQRLALYQSRPNVLQQTGDHRQSPTKSPLLARADEVIE